MEADGFDVDLPGTVLTVAELNSDIGAVIKNARNDELSFDFLIGDVSNDSESNGTRYFQLVNEDSGIQCLVFAGTRKTLPEFEEGDRVAVKGRLSYYESRGNCSLYVDDVILVGESHYHQKIAELRQNLEEEGLYDESRKQDLPPYPSSIGIVTSKDSDAEEDAVNAIQSRYPDINIHLHHSRVQGIAALEDLCNAITMMDALEYIDVIVVTRGGGSEQDLHAFNTEGVSRTIAATDTPVVTAIGHENDRPIVDDVADNRAMTPTEIGSVVVVSKDNKTNQVDRTVKDLHTSFSRFRDSTIDRHYTRLNDSYENHVSKVLTRLSNELDNAYDVQTSNRMTDLENKLDTSYEVFKQEKQHEEETDTLAKQQRKYKIAIAVLLLLLLGIFIWMSL